MSSYDFNLFLKRCCCIIVTLVAAVPPLIAQAPISSAILQNSDDGTEVDETYWYEYGFLPSINALGNGTDGKKYEVGFRFFVDDLHSGDEITYARLRLSSRGSIISSSAELLIEGVLQESPTSFSDNERPSQKLPRTNAQIQWRIDEDWISGVEKMPVYYSSPDISSIINEILALPGWGSGPEGKALIVTLEVTSTDTGEANLVGFEDYWSDNDLRSPAVLEIYRTVYDTFIGKEFLGRVETNSITLSLFSLIETDVYVVYGTSSGDYTESTAVYMNQPAEQGLEVVIDNLSPNNSYYYRLMYRKSGEAAFESGEERTFRTKRSSGAPFSFAVQSDEHLGSMFKLPPDTRGISLYKQTVANIAAGNPDFFISLGDFGIGGDGYPPGIDPGPTGGIFFQEGKERYLLQREYLDCIAHSIPFYLVIGNHEGEQGWYYNGDSTSSAALLTKARKEIIPNPVPDAFYSGGTDTIPGVGLRESCYSWEWGDALFVVLDPFWNTTTKPHNWHGPGSLNGWDWTIGKEQYDWLYEVLHNADTQWKFVFIHHLASTTVPNCYGRGGIEVVKYRVDGNPSFEWGGEDEFGNYVFDSERPDWNHGAIHDMLVAENVTIVFHGHDHLFAAQQLDGVVYQECPRAADADYTYGHKVSGGYRNGRLLPNSGHVVVTVDPLYVRVEYIRAYLPGDGENGEVGFSYVIPF